jgi:hypothetical protein
VFEPKFNLVRGKVRWESVLFFLGVAAVLAVLNSCGSSSSTATPTISVSCTPSDVTVLSTSQCTATVENESSTLVNWTISPAGAGSITAGGLYTAPSAVPTNNVVTVTATSQVASTLTATQNLTLEQATAIAAVTCLDPSTDLASSTVSSGNQLACTATASTGATVAVDWSVANTNDATNTLNLGIISPQGIYTAPLVPPPGQSITITATSQAPGTPPVSVKATVVFGSAVLSGNYVFSTSGRLTTDAFWARVGSFSAGGGAITGGIEDTNQGGSPNTVITGRALSGSYSVGPDGRGTMQFCESASSNSQPPTSCPAGSGSATAYFRIVVVSPNRVEIVEYSSPTTTSALLTAGGEMVSQDPSVFSAGVANLSGTYSFNFAGVSTAAAEESAVGQFTAAGFGVNGTASVCAGSTPPPTCRIDFSGSSVASLGASTYTIGSSGRGTITLDGFNFSFYPISVSQSKFLEIDTSTTATPASILSGTAYLEQSTVTCGWGQTALSGTTVLETTGSSSGVVVQDVGSFTAASGSVSAGSIDENSGGTYSSTVGTLTGNYTVDSCGRGTLSVGTHSYVLYVISASSAVLQEITSGTVAYGLLEPSQGGPIAATTLTGSYSLRMGGTDAAQTAGHRQDFLGQFTSSGTGTIPGGTLDFNDFGTTQAGDAVTNGTYAAPSPAGSIRATMALPVATTPNATTKNLVLYMVSPALFYVLDTDQSPAGTALGVINNQF